jgi:putative molybdopterin biosynthesis protein
VRAAAIALGLEFIRVANEEYDLLISRPFFDSARGAELVKIVSAASFKQAVGALGGYDTAHSGTVLYRQ